MKGFLIVSLAVLTIAFKMINADSAASTTANSTSSASATSNTTGPATAPGVDSQVSSVPVAGNGATTPSTNSEGNPSGLFSLFPNFETLFGGIMNGIPKMSSMTNIVH